MRLLRPACRGSRPEGWRDFRVLIGWIAGEAPSPIEVPAPRHPSQRRQIVGRNGSRSGRRVSTRRQEVAVAVLPLEQQEAVGGTGGVASPARNASGHCAEILADHQAVMSLAFQRNNPDQVVAMQHMQDRAFQPPDLRDSRQTRWRGWRRDGSGTPPRRPSSVRLCTRRSLALS